MNTGAQQAAGASGEWTRREMVAALARWTVPTVLTLSLATRSAYAAASCPPCTKNTGGRCRACTTSQQLNCQCEPCLGPPYCPAPGGVAPMQPSTGTNPSASGQSRGNTELINALRQRRSALEGGRAPSPFGRADSIFGRNAQSPFGRGPLTPDAQRLRNQSAARQGLYDRLRDFDSRRRP